MPNFPSHLVELGGHLSEIQLPVNGGHLYTPPGPQILYPETGAELATFMGLATAPDSTWHYTNSAGNYIDISTGGNDLVVNVTTGLTRGVQSSALGSRTFEVADGTNPAIEAATSGVFDIDAATSITILRIMEIVTTPGGDRVVLGKASNPGYRYFVRATGASRFRLNGSADIETGPDQGLGVPHHVILQMDRAGDSLRVFTNDGNSAGQAIAAGTMVNATLFNVATGASAPTANLRVAMDAVWVGVGAEQDFSGAIAALRAAQGF